MSRREGNVPSGNAYEGWRTRVHHDTSDCARGQECGQECDCICHVTHNNLDVPVQKLLGMPRRTS